MATHPDVPYRAVRARAGNLVRLRGITALAMRSERVRDSEKGVIVKQVV